MTSRNKNGGYSVGTVYVGCTDIDSIFSVPGTENILSIAMVPKSKRFIVINKIESAKNIGETLKLTYYV